MTTGKIIDQMNENEKPRFSSDSNPEQFSCGLSFEAGAC